MRKIFTLLAAVAMSVTGAMATTFTFESDADLTQTKDGYTVTIAKGSGQNDPKWYSNGMRLYASNTITVSGAGLENISMTFAMQGSKAYAGLTASTGSLVSGGESTSSDNKVTDKWTGSANSVTFTLGSTGQRLIFDLEVNGDGSQTPVDPDPDDPTDPDTPPTLNPDFVYPEPTLISVPSTTVQGDTYSFIDNNVLVSCTKGAVTADYFSAHAGFDMTFTATKPIKGIVVNGFVKKDFTATVDHGDISYLCPSADTSADPVVVIKDINSTSVTISCVKQLRCYDVEVYFDANPEATVQGGATTDPSATTLTFDSADAVYESEYAELLGEPNYSIYLYDAVSPDVPYFALDLYPAEKDNLAGTYSWDDYTLGDYTYYVYGYNENDMTWAEGGLVTISKNGNTYTISGNIICDNNKTYNISYTGVMDFYTDDEYYGGGSYEEVELDFDTAEAVYESAYSEALGKLNYSIFLYNSTSPAYPYFALDIYPAVKDELAGDYSYTDYTLGDYTYYLWGEGDNDLTSILDGEVSITKTGNVYTIFGLVLCDDYKLYTINFSGELPIYTDDEYYGDSSGIKGIGANVEKEADRYDMLGRKVGSNYRGIYIQNGKKYIGR